MWSRRRDELELVCGFRVDGSVTLLQLIQLVRGDIRGPERIV